MSFFCGAHTFDKCEVEKWNGHENGKNGADNLCLLHSQWETSESQYFRKQLASLN